MSSVLLDEEQKKEDDSFVASPLLTQLPVTPIWDVIYEILEYQDLVNLGRACPECIDSYLSVEAIWAAVLRERDCQVIKCFTYSSSTLENIHFPSLLRWLRIFEEKDQRCEVCSAKKARYIPHLGLFCCYSIWGCWKLTARCKILPCEFTKAQQVRAKSIKYWEVQCPWKYQSRCLYDEETGEAIGLLATREHVASLKDKLDWETDDEVYKAFNSPPGSRVEWRLKMKLLSMYVPAVNKLRNTEYTGQGISSIQLALEAVVRKKQEEEEGTATNRKK